MYNNIPSERTSKRAIFVALLCCITLVSVLAAGYFALMAKDMQTRFAQFETLEELENSKDELQAILAVEDEEVVIPEFTYPEAVQVPFLTEAPEGRTLLSATLRDWQEANKDTGYCASVSSYATYEKVNQYGTTARQSLADEGIRGALVAYFQVAPEFEEVFFAGIESAIDEDDRFALGYTMCSGNGRKFLLLEEVTTVQDSEMLRSQTQAFPLVLEWLNPPAAGSAWITYNGDYRALDGYALIPDWNGDVILQTGYGDAGYANWEVQLLSIDPPGGSIPVVTTLEKCNVEPTENYEDSILMCEVRYTE